MNLPDLEFGVGVECLLHDAAAVQMSIDSAAAAPVHRHTRAQRVQTTAHSLGKVII